MSHRNKNYYQTLFLIISFIMINSGCENSTEGGDPPAKSLTAIVKNSHGDLLSDVKVFLMYNFDQIEGNLAKETSGNKPLELNSVLLNTFYAVPISQSQIVIYWSTAWEINNFGFEIQEKQDEVFNTIGFVNGNGTTDTTHEYSFTADVEIREIYTFRLKIIEFNGSFEYSYEIETTGIIYPNESQLFQNYPNPFDISTTFNFTIRKLSYVEFAILNFKDEPIIPSFWADSLSPGTYQRINNFSNLIPCNGYKMIMEIDEYNDSSYSFEKSFIRTYSFADTSLKNNLPNAISYNGRFEIKYGDLPLNQKYVRTFEADPSPIGILKVNNILKLVLYKPGYKVTQKDLIINPDESQEIEIHLEEE